MFPGGQDPCTQTVWYHLVLGSRGRSPATKGQAVRPLSRLDPAPLFSEQAAAVVSKLLHRITRLYRDPWETHALVIGSRVVSDRGRRSQFLDWVLTLKRGAGDVQRGAPSSSPGFGQGILGDECLAQA